MWSSRVVVNAFRQAELAHSRSSRGNTTRSAAEHAREQ